MRSPKFLLRAFACPIGALAALVWSLSSYGPYVRLVAFVALFALAADLASFARGAAQNMLVLLASLLFGAAAIETIALSITPRVVILHPPGLWGARAELGWGPTRPGRYPAEKRVDGKTIYKVTYTIGDDLLRRTASAGPGHPLVAFFGDSITFGEGLDDPDTLPQAFADLVPGAEIVNLAFSAYSPSQVLRELQLGMFDERLAGARAFVLLTGPWHAERTACKPNFSVRAPRYQIVGGSLAYRGPCFSGVAQHIAEFYKETATYAAFLAPLLQRPTHLDIETYIEIVDAVATLARDKYGVPLVVLYRAPADHYLDGTGFSDADVRGRLRAAGVHLIDAELAGHSAADLIIPGDGHPSALANRLQARKLFDDLAASLPKVARSASP